MGELLADAEFIIDYDDRLSSCVHQDMYTDDMEPALEDERERHNDDNTHIRMDATELRHEINGEHRQGLDSNKTPVVDGAAAKRTQ
jgi:hypothetical protein